MKRKNSLNDQSVATQSEISQFGQINRQISLYNNSLKVSPFTPKKVLFYKLVITFKLLGHFSSLLDAAHSQLHGYIEAVKKVSPEHDRISTRVDAMNPSRGHEQRPAGLDHDSLTLAHHIRQEDVGLLARQDPSLVDAQVFIGGRYEPENLLARKHMIPNRGTSHVHVKVSPTLGHAHEHVLLHLRILHFVDYIRRKVQFY